MASITVTSPSGREVIHLTADVRIGRSDENEIMLSDARVSKFHARLTRGKDGWVFEDSGSTNGSLINGKSMERAVLKDGDVIALGHSQLVFDASQDSPAEARREQPAAPREPTRFSETMHKRIEELFSDDSTVSAIHSISAAPRRPGEGDAAEDAGMLLRRLKVCYEISSATAATLDLSEILDRVLGVLFGTFDTAEHAFILLADPDTHIVDAAAVKHRGGCDTEDIAISHTALEQAMRKREAVLCLDAASDSRYARAESIVTLGIRSLMIAPVAFQEEVLGAIYVDTRQAARQFDTDDLQLLSAAAAQVGSCVANALLHGRLVASERLAAVGQTVAGLTHCIKNILQGIKGGAFIVDKALSRGDSAQLEKGWDIVRRNNSFMEGLVFDLLSLSKERAPEFESADLNEVAAEACRMCQARADGEGVTLGFDGSAEMEPVELDPRGICRSLINLVGNAIDACKDNGGAVRVRTQGPSDGGFVSVAVADGGCGMSEETLAKLFTVFFSTKGSKGTGLGLAVTKKIIEEHGGRIEVDSRVGEGTTFTVLLPAVRRSDTRKGAVDEQ